MLHRFLGFGAVFVLAATVGGCYVGGDLCKSGEVVECTGDDGCSGQQVCQDDGSFAPCVCAQAPETTAEGEPQVQTSDGSTSSATTSGDSESSSGEAGSSSIGESTGTDGQDCTDVEDCLACLSVIELRNDKSDEDDMEDLCKGDKPTKSIMYVSQTVGVYEQFVTGAGVEITLTPGETQRLELACCMLDMNKCESGYEQMCEFRDVVTNVIYPCQCTFHELMLKGDFCGEKTVLGCNE